MAAAAAGVDLAAELVGVVAATATAVAAVAAVAAAMGVE